ncbi:MAG TPA: DNA polymerase III subunit gamma/tau [Ktedonobacteraceae bacterium]|nr:DNA polymerase III subunit gamma/tau [Ktedonobacteraceae bacterium]
MASQSLYRKWRSQTFSEMVGQEAIIRTLKNALSEGKLAHAYLFTGPRGTGKTSTARLLAKTLNCLQLQNGEPCNECQQCREITAGNSFNVIEIDAASNRGIDSIRELREKVMVPPSTGKYKVYILDEAHMLTTEAFNALLKTLEEPPPHAIFVMATTDVHKMLPTVISRCQPFNFKRFTTRQIVGHLNFVAEQEQVQLEHGAAELIARAAAGGMRDALSLLDQAIAYSGQHITLAQVQSMLGVADQRAIQKFIAHVAQLDSPGGLHLIHELADAGADLRQINTQVADYWRAMMLSKAGADTASILDCTQEEIREIVELAQQFKLEELTECARIFAQNELMQKNVATPQLGLELAFLACVALHGQTQGGLTTAATVASTPPSTIARPAPIQQTQPAAASAVQPRPVVKNEVPSPPPKVNEEPVSALPDWDAVSYSDDPEPMEPAPVLAQADQADAGASSEPDVTDQASVQDVPSLTVQEVKEKWEYVKRRVRTRKDGAKIAAVLNGYTIIGVDQAAGLPVVLIRATATFHYTAIQKSEYHESIEWAMKVELGQECRVRLLPPDAAGVPVQIPPPSPPSSDPGSRSANTMMTIAPQRPAHRERPTAKQNGAQHQPPAPQRTQDGANAVGGVSTASNKPSSLARNTLVRENTSTMTNATGPSMKVAKTGESQQEYLKKKATADPVVQKVAEMFKAEIKDFHLK